MSEETANSSDNSLGKAPQLRPFHFQPGQSGNPSGRPKKKPVTEIYEELLDDPEVREAIKQAIKGRLLSNRMVGNLELKEATERIEGKITQPSDVNLTIDLSLAERFDKACERADRD